MKNIFRILTINPGSTSTKIGVFDNEELVLEKTLRHSSEECLKVFSNINSSFSKTAIFVDVDPGFIANILKISFIISYLHSLKL